ncbi:hypothetical protein POM88_019156 [Heracleum sosnowskyi]|uniref:Uncharacterized protein n=1 Tax=Heracleum sosnowskyi TaxID=360622 RepID=A0AAD8N128_9APIA|nr:hypothetical protein POM88_019156 [Heracleum sosnowskyi]
MYGQLVMGLFYKRINACVGRDSGDLVPSAKKLLKLMFKKIGEYKVAGAVAGKVYELRGFPCQYAVCVLQQVRPNWVQYCARYYLVDNYKITYASGLVPLEGPDNWEEPRATIVPHLLIRKPGRPRKNRRKAYDETLPEKKPRCCSKCKQPGHNKTTCGGGLIGSNTKRKMIRVEVDG